MKKLKEIYEYDGNGENLPHFEEVYDEPKHYEIVTYKDALNIALKVLKNMD